MRPEKRDARAGGPGGAMILAAKSEPSDDGPITRVVLLDEIRQKSTALAHELEEAATRVVVLREAAQVIREALDPLCQERDLHFRRTGVAIIDCVALDQLLSRL